MITRRALLKSTGLSLVTLGFGATPLFLARAANAVSTSLSGARRKILVCVFQRGAMDGLMAVQPFNDKYFVNARNRLRMNAGSGGALTDLDGRFALHPAFAPFKKLFDEKRLAIIHGIGSPDTSRSHFDAQDYMENGTPGRKTGSGWLNRAASQLHQGDTPFQSVAFTPAMPLSLYGDHPSLAIDDLNNFKIQSSARSNSKEAASQSFEALYARTSQQILRGSGRESFDAIKLLDNARLNNYSSSVGANYPKSPLAEHFKQVAQLIRADVGLEIAFVESTGWDTHVQQGTVNGQFSRVASDFAQSIAAFWNDISSHQDEVVLMTMTEFGRTVKENGSGGTDHGRGSCMFVLGNSVKGGSVLGDVPELAPENLADGRDLPVTTDFRSLFAGAANRHLGIAESDKLFPGWTGRTIDIFRT